MKTRNKVLLTLACAVLLVTASVMGTLAWLTSTGTVTNTFTVGQVKITLDEAAVNIDGEKLNKEGNIAENDSDLADRVSGANKYHLMPGHTYVKDPTIHVQANSEECYLFVTLDNGFLSLIDSNSDTIKNIEEQMFANGWKKLAQDGDNQNVWYYAENENLKTVAKSAKVQDIKLFESFKIKDEATNELLAGVKDNTITVKAYAIQKDGISEKNIAGIWNILDTATGSND